MRRLKLLKDIKLKILHCLYKLKRDRFCELLPKENKIFKIETVKALRSLDYFLKKKKTLIDRGDLSKEVGIENIPKIQEKYLKSKKFRKINIAIAKIFGNNDKKSLPNRQANDIYSSLEMGKFVGASR